jgi:diadenosine tetraphosphate (Ap4A) HIT family hydrolase
MEKEILLWETNCWGVILHTDQKYLGRAVVVLKRSPCGSLSELLPAEWLDLSEHVIKPYESSVKKAFGAELFNWACLMNLAYQNTPPDPHVHWHVKPRYRHPVEISDTTFTDEKFGRHYEAETTRLVSSELMNEITSRIRSAHDDLSKSI